MRPPAASKARAVDVVLARVRLVARPSASWIAKPSGVGSNVWRRMPLPKRAPSWSTSFGERIGERVVAVAALTSNVVWPA